MWHLVVPSAHSLYALLSTPYSKILTRTHHSTSSMRLTHRPPLPSCVPSVAITLTCRVIARLLLHSLTRRLTSLFTHLSVCLTRGTRVTHHRGLRSMHARVVLTYSAACTHVRKSPHISDASSDYATERSLIVYSQYSHTLTHNMPTLV